MKILKCLLMIVTAPVILVLTLFVWLCTGLIYISGLVLGLFSTVIALLGVAVLLSLIHIWMCIRDSHYPAGTPEKRHRPCAVWR